MKSNRLNVLPRKFISAKAAGDPGDAAECGGVSCFRENDMEKRRARARSISLKTTLTAKSRPSGERDAMTLTR
jgi:hypothetical protein